MHRNGKILIALMTAAVLLLTASAAVADTEIQVTGTGETRISADTAVISLGVRAVDKDVQNAQRQVNGVIAEIRKALTEIGIPEENINTDYMSIYAVYDYESELEKVKAYNASSTLAIRVTQIDQAGSVIDAAFGAGANTLNGISFSASDTSKAREESLKLAVADARARAEALAEASGMKITGIERISEGNVFSYDNSVGNFSAKAMDRGEAASGTVVQAAKLVVTATVTVTFGAK